MLLCVNGGFVPAPYSMAFACLDCQKSFKRGFKSDDGYPESLKCQDCGGTAYNFGRHFKAPKKNDQKQWEKVRYLFKHGFRFQKIRTGLGQHDVIPYPENLEQAKEFVERYKDYALPESSQNT